jgi:diketogulonate reductase-like aldo/keto reductase
LTHTEAELALQGSRGDTLARGNWQARIGVAVNPHLRRDVVITASGLHMPRMLYGTAWKKEQTETLVRQAIHAGFRGIDTACQPKHYHEPGVGAALAACLNEGMSRDQLFVQTKFTSPSGQDPKRIPYDPDGTAAEQVAQSFETSLANLQTQYVDSLVLHSPYSRDEQTLDVWRAMEPLADRGSVKQLGISNCYSLKTLQSLCRASRIKPAVLQNRFYAETDYDREIRSFCREQNIIYQSFWTLTANPRLLAGETVRLLSVKYHRSPAQILFRYLTQVEVVPLTGTRSEAHMREDLAIFEFELAADEIEAVTALL